MCLVSCRSISGYYYLEIDGRISANNYFVIDSQSNFLFCSYSPMMNNNSPGLDSGTISLENGKYYLNSYPVIEESGDLQHEHILFEDTEIKFKRNKLVYWHPVSGNKMTYYKHKE